MKIKRFTLLSLSVGVLSVAALVGFTNERSGKYDQLATSDDTDGDYISRIGSAVDFIHRIRANVTTGKVSYEEYAQAKKQVQKNMLAGNKNLSMSWDFLGPDNVGGRTRTMIVDMYDPNTLYAGSASGGIFVSNNGGSSWTSYSDDLENNAIASMVQTANGDIYFSTGPLFDNPHSDQVQNKDIKSIFLGSGVYKLTGNGSVQKIVGPSTPNSTTVDWAMTSKLATDPNDASVLYAGMNNGFRYSHDGGALWEVPNGINPNAGEVNDIEVASDGTVMVTFSEPGRLYTSTDQGANFTQITGIPLTANDNRIEYAIAPSDPNVHYFIASSNTGCLRGVFQSVDKGQTFSRIIGPSQDAYDFLHNSSDCYGAYSNALAVYPDDPYKILVGGYRLFRWEQSTFPPAKPNGSMFELGSINPNFGNFLHPFKHGFYFSNDSTLYVATDGGVSKSVNVNSQMADDITFSSINFGYTTSQYFSVGVGPNGLLVGGTQGNGINIVGFGFNQGKSAYQILGSDGFTMDAFDSDFSNLDPSIAFSAQPYTQVKRITGIGNTLGSSNFPDFVQGINPLYLDDNSLANKCGISLCGTYYTASRLWESFYDPTSQSTVEFELIVERDETIPVGSKITYNSLTNDIPLQYTTTQAYTGPSRIDSVVVVDGDTVVYPEDTLYTLTATDYVQSILAVGNIEYDPATGNNFVWMTRHAIHGNGPFPIDWINIAGNSGLPINGQIIAMEFSTDGNHLFVGTTRETGGGDLYRISGLNQVYTDEDGNLGSSPKTTVTLLASYGQGGVTGIAVDPNNPENVIITIGNYGHNQYVYRSTTAVTALFPGSFISIMGSGATALPNAPAYDAMIDYMHNDTVLVGTDFGVYSTHNAFEADPSLVEWTYENSGLPAVPVYEIRQQTFGIDDSSRGITNTGEVYIATHGRGLFKSDELVGIDDIFADNDSEAKRFGQSLNIYPNPATNQSNFSFELASASNVVAKVYNVHGKLAREVNFGKMAAGFHTGKIKIMDLPTGTYILQLIADGNAATGKFVIQR